jgi:hypothetical protein
MAAWSKAIPTLQVNINHNIKQPEIINLMILTIGGLEIINFHHMQFRKKFLDPVISIKQLKSAAPLCDI